eukprot:1178343-Prorocentrum_minimum.AAC.8
MLSLLVCLTAVGRSEPHPDRQGVELADLPAVQHLGVDSGPAANVAGAGGRADACQGGGAVDHPPRPGHAGPARYLFFPCGWFSVVQLELASPPVRSLLSIYLAIDVYIYLGCKSIYNIMHSTGEHRPRTVDEQKGTKPLTKPPPMRLRAPRCRQHCRFLRKAKAAYVSGVHRDGSSRPVLARNTDPAAPDD